jgi:HlyD family secretion protein
MKRWRRVLIPALVLGALIVWRIGQKNAEVAGQAAQRAMRMKGPAIVALAPVQFRDITRSFEGTGSVEAPLSVKIAPKITGRIDFLTVHEGDRIRKGQVLVRIDSTEVEANVQQAMAALAEAQYKLAQARITQNPTDVGVSTQLRQQQAAMASAEADYNQTCETVKAQNAAAAASVSDASFKVENASAALNSAQANLENAKTRLKRLSALLDKGYVSAQAVDDAQAQEKVQQAALGIAQAQLNSAKALKDAAVQQLTVVKSKGAADTAASKAKLLQARASVDYAKANTSQTSAYRQSIAALQAGVDAARASLKSAQARRRDTVLTSPLDGFVTGRFADPGAIASPSQPVLAVQFMKQVWVSVAVPEEVCSRLHIGGTAKVRLDAVPDKTFTASIIQINPSADVQSRQFTVRVILSNQADLLKPGMFAHVTFETERIPHALVVPREAIQRDKMGSFVMIADRSMKAKRVSVMTDAEDEQFVSIKAGLEAGQKVITMSAMPVREGQTVIPGGGKMPGGKRGPMGGPGQGKRGGKQ